eukprot:UN04040
MSNYTQYSPYLHNQQGVIPSKTAGTTTNTLGEGYKAIYDMLYNTNSSSSSNILSNTIGNTATKTMSLQQQQQSEQQYRLHPSLDPFFLKNEKTPITLQQVQLFLASPVLHQHANGLVLMLPLYDPLCPAQYKNVANLNPLKVQQVLKDQENRQNQNVIAKHHQGGNHDGNAHDGHEVMSLTQNDNNIET